MIAGINKIARKVLEKTEEPAVRLLLFRDVLGFSVEDSRVRAALKEISRSVHVQILKKEQRRDGGWGAFHTKPYKCRAGYYSTETAVERAVALGLDGSHPVLNKALQYILRLMDGSLSFPDYEEKNNRWSVGKRLFLAATLARIDPDNAALNRDRKLWRDIAIRAFKSGKYSPGHEAEAHLKLTGATVEGSYLVIGNRYVLNILARRQGLIPSKIEKAFFEWLWRRPEGVGYLNVPMFSNPAYLSAGQFDRWLTSFELMLRAFPTASESACKAVDWILQQADREGLWDFGGRSSGSVYFPLSGSWRRIIDRRIDWTTRILLLLRSLKS